MTHCFCLHIKYAPTNRSKGYIGTSPIEIEAPYGNYHRRYPVFTCRCIFHSLGKILESVWWGHERYRASTVNSILVLVQVKIIYSGYFKDKQLISFSLISLSTRSSVRQIFLGLNSFALVCLSIVLFSSILSAQAPIFFTNTFDIPPTLAATETAGAWYPDRYRPTACRSIPAREHPVFRAVCMSTVWKPDPSSR